MLGAIAAALLRRWVGQGPVRDRARTIPSIADCASRDNLRSSEGPTR